MENTTEFKNETISVSLEKFPGCHIKFEVSIFPEASKAAYAKALKAVKKEVSLPGFRTGKAPDAVIVKSYKPHVDKEWEEILLDEAFREACQLVKTYPYAKESVKKVQVVKLSKEENSKFTIEFESYPEVPSIAFSEIDFVPVERKAVEEKDVNEHIEHLRFNSAKFEEIDREIQENDKVQINIQPIDSTDFLPKDTDVILRKEQTPAWLYEALIGRRTHDIIEVAAPTNSQESSGEETENQKKSIPCKVTIKNAQKSVLPDLDDAFAESVGAQDKADLLKKVEQELNYYADREQEKKTKANLHNLLLEKAVFDLPTSVMKLYPNNNEAERQYRSYFLMNKLASDNDITVNDREIIQEYATQMWTGRYSDLNMDDYQKRKTEIYLTLLEDKILDLFIEHNEKKLDQSSKTQHDEA